MDWYSALLVFQLDSPADPQFRKKLESLVVFKAKDFPDAHRIALEIGTKRPQNEIVVDDSGSPAILPTFCFVKNLDLVGPQIDGHEVWSKLSELTVPITHGRDYIPSQTI